MSTDKIELPCCTNEAQVQAVLEKMPAEEVLYDTGDFFKILGDSTRIKILFALLQGELCVGDLSACLGLSQSAISHQLRILRQSNLVKFQKDGKTVIYSLDDAHVEQILATGLAHIEHRRGASL